MPLVFPPQIVYPIDQFLIAAGIVLQQYPEARGIRVSAWGRTVDRAVELAELGKGVGSRSLHTRFLAFDLVGTAVQTDAFRRGWSALGLDAVPEGDHLHVEFDGPALRRFGVDFRVA